MIKVITIPIMTSYRRKNPAIIKPWRYNTKRKASVLYLHDKTKDVFIIGDSILKNVNSNRLQKLKK